MLRALLDCPVHAIMEVTPGRVRRRRRPALPTPPSRREPMQRGATGASPSDSGTPLPQLTVAERVLLDVGRRRRAAHPGVPGLQGADPPAGSRSAGTAAATTWACARSPARPRCPASPSTTASASPACRRRTWSPRSPSQEDPRVRLTTNIVDCDPDELELGQLVEVVFEQVDDVWLPLFRPRGPRAARRPARRRDRTRRISPSYVRPLLTSDQVRGQGRPSPASARHGWAGG